MKTDLDYLPFVYSVSQIFKKCHVSINDAGSFLIQFALTVNTPRLPYVQPCDEDASKRNKELVNSGKLQLGFDTGDLLAYVYL